MSELILAFLGPAQITHRQKGQVSFPNRKALALLAYLAVESARAHSRESLLGLLWPELPTPDAQNNLRVTWSQLQKGLGRDPDISNPCLIGGRLDLQFNPHCDHTLDVTLFWDLLEACRTHAHASRPDCAECAERLTQALALVRGEFLEGLSLGDCPAFEEWLFVQRERLHLQIIKALEELAGFHERAENPESAEKYVHRLLELDPLHEPAHRQLMRLLAGAGRRSAALAQFETCRRLLAVGLGVAPAPETIVLAEQIRALAPTQSDAPRPRHNLPPTVSRFIGRSEESAQLQQLLTREEAGVVTLAGPGGVGKTRLAVQVAHNLVNRFTNGVWLVELAGVNDTLAVPSTVASALNVVPDARRSLLRALGDYLRDKSLLLVLDNCEHLLEPCAQLVTALHLAAPELVVFATSRTPLHLEGERVIRLQPLPTPELNPQGTLTAVTALENESIQLFASRATQALLSFAITDSNTAPIAQICQHLDGIPLAIELAAARAGSMSVEAIAQRLHQRFRWLDSQSSGKMPRQKTLRALIDWSYDLLHEQERVLFRRLAVFSGGWTLEAAEAICEEQDLCVDLLGRLVDQSLVVFGFDPEGKRYRMHESIHQFALEKLSEMGEEVETAVFGQHSQTYLSLLASHTDGFWGRTPRESIRIIQRDLDNVRQAWQWAVEQRRLDLMEKAVLGLARFHEGSSLFLEGQTLLSETSAQVQDWLNKGLVEEETTLTLQARLFTETASFLTQRAQADQAIAATEKAIEMAERAGDFGSEARACSLLGVNYVTRGRNDLALPFLLRGLERARAAGLRAIEGILLRYLGNVWRQRGDFVKEKHYLLEALAAQQASGYLAEEQSVLLWLGYNSYYTGEYIAAQKYLIQAEKLNDVTGDPMRAVRVRQGLGMVKAALGRYEHALHLLQEVVRLSKELDNRWQEVYALGYLATVNGRLGNVEESLSQARAALTAAEEAQFGELAASAATILGYLLTTAGRWSDAADVFASARQRWEAIDRKSGEVEATVGLALATFESGNDVRARELIEEVISFINDGSLQGTEDPIRIYLTCYRILHSAEDSRAGSLLVRAYEQTQSIATAIEDETLQKLFLESVPAHRELMQLWGQRER